MQELRLVAVSEDGSYAVLAVPGRGGRFALPIDDRLRTVARGQFSRLAQYEIEVESPLRPKEIQDRIRAGETADEIADAAGIPIERIRRFEGPVLAEREYRAQEAQRATIRGVAEPGPGPRLGDVVAERLADTGASEPQWDSRKRTDGNWQVQLMFTIAGRPFMAEWVFDPRRRHVQPADDFAARLSLPEAEWPASRADQEPATATVTPIASRLGGAAAFHQDVRADDRFARPGAAAQDGFGHARPAVAHARPEAPAAPAAPPAIPPDRARPAAAVASGPAGPAASGPASRDEGEPAAGPAGPARPARRSGGGRSRRSSVPSWDEIMLGNTRQSE
jgi:hypothetical protein